MDDSLRQAVWDRAGGTCEYCHVPLAYDVLPYEVDHIIAEQHGGRTRLSNLAVACAACNKYKGPNVAGVGGPGGRVVRLFHPRRHRWGYPFRWEGPFLVRRTAIGRVTVAVLRINLPYRVRFRAALMAAGVFPTQG